ncbi:MAG: CCA tRNA nucleotidyltransferase [Planctomycetota bacterium]
MLRAPAMQDLSVELSAAARTIARALGTAGHRAWIVGGAPRDLALRRAVLEIDMASSARPEEVEALFDATFPAGRAFGTVVVRAGGIDVQHTTFRSEHGFTDARHPDHVGFGATPEEDSRRRDFTCNALYLDPLDDTLLDPQGGLADLSAGRLACVGDPRRRFQEDGLRLLRMGRFAARANLELAPGVLDAARQSLDALRGVSPERVLGELEKLFECDAPAHGVAILCDAQVLPRCLPAALTHDHVRAGVCARAPVFEHLRAPGAALGFAALLGAVDGGDDDVRETVLGALQALRASRALQRRVGGILAIARELARATSRARSRGERVQLLRDVDFAAALLLASAWSEVGAADSRAVTEWRDEHARTTVAELRPVPFVTAEDLARTTLPHGPRWGSILREAETLQLDGTLATRADALTWLDRRVGDATPPAR